VPAVEPVTNQVCLIALDAAVVGDPRGNKRPDHETFGRHRDHFDRLMDAQEFNPFPAMKLPADWEYKTTNAPGFHSTGRSTGVSVWAITPEGRYVGPVDALFDELTAIRWTEGLKRRSDLIRGALRHSHWEGIRGGVGDIIIVENTLGSKFPAVAVEVSELRQALNLPPGEERDLYFGVLFGRLSVTR